MNDPAPRARAHFPPALTRCQFCRYPFNLEILGRNGCPKCHGDGLADEAAHRCAVSAAVDAPTALGFVVYGLPGPQGSKRFMGRSKAGRGILVESSAKVRPWREAVKWAALEAMREAAEKFRLDLVVHGQAATLAFPLDGPLRVWMTFTMPKPASAPKRRRTWPMRTPDGSKLQRSTEDALTDAGLWQDDARVVEWFGAKRYPGEGLDALDSPGVRIRIEAIT